MHGIRDVERFLERCDARRAGLADADAGIYVEGRVETTRGDGCGLGSTWRSGYPGVGKEFLDSKALRGINAEQV